MDPNSQASNGSTVATPPADATGGTPQPNPTQTQPANTAPVDGGSAGDQGNSGHDGGDGSQGDEGGGGRPSRAQRTINDLTARAKAAEEKLTKQDDLITRLTQGVDPDKVKLPEYADGEQITPERIKKDVVSAASQIAALTIAPAIKELAGKVIERDGAKNALSEFRQAEKDYPKLNEADDDHYDPELASRINTSYKRFFDVDPSYGFAEHLELFAPELKSSTSTTAPKERGTGARGTSINRGSGSGTRRTQKSPEDMSMDELEAYIHAGNAE